MNYKIIQITKINSGDFTFNDPTNVSYPIAPLVSCNLINDASSNPILKIRTTLYVNSKDSDTPSVRTLKVTDKNILKIKYQCSFSKETPETCDVWYVEIDYTGEDANRISQIISFLKNTKPGNLNDDIEAEGDTSRGTKTDPNNDGSI
ncbi:hypothetical protein [Flavobacterium adhaerens]|uniref:hypothetical protein n=1 Tax=Flavobacterium adhaerens TaxID=3149043 RepID=UPI0032B45073